MRGLLGRRTSVVTVLVIALVAFALVLVMPRMRTTHLVVEFSSGQGLHPGDEVRVLGVKVGTIDRVTPTGDHVEVRLSVGDGRKVPTGAGAVVISPNLVGGSYVQLAPAYDGGPALADGARISLDRTAVPVRWDEVKSELISLTQSLGPTARDPKGSLSTALSGTASALRGNGALLASSVTQASAAARTLVAGSGDFYTTIRNLGVFLRAMNNSDTAVVTFARELAAVSDILEENRGRLESLLVEVSDLMKGLRTFIKENGAAVRTSVSRAKTLVHDLQALQVDLANILHLAPTTLANFYNIYDPSTGAFTGRPALAHAAGLSNLACQAIYSAGGTLADCKKALGSVLDQLPIGDLPIGTSGPVQGGASNQQQGNGSGR